jgi:hypothetical protein
MVSTSSLAALTSSSAIALRTRPTTRLPLVGPVAVIAYAAGRAEEPARCLVAEPADACCLRERGAQGLAAIDEAIAALTQAAPGGALFDAEGDPVADLVVVGVWTLQRERTDLEAALAYGDLDRGCDACSSARRAVVRALAAIEGALLGSGAEQGAAGRLLAQETERALRVRGAYRGFRAAVRGAVPATPVQVEARLGAVGVAVAGIFASSAWPAMRASDRRLFREIDARLQDRTGRDEGSTPGLRLWQDVAAFAGCLRAVNHRPELVAHDARAASAALAALPTDDALRVDDSLLEALGPLLGRDDELDELLLGRAPVRTGALRARLSPLARR